MLFSYFVYIAHLTKFTRGRSLLMEKSLLREKSKRKKILAKKNIGMLCMQEVFCVGWVYYLKHCK